MLPTYKIFYFVTLKHNLTTLVKGDRLSLLSEKLYKKNLKKMPELIVSAYLYKKKLKKKIPELTVLAYLYKKNFLCQNYCLIGNLPKPN